MKTIHFLNKLIDSGVRVFKIEGRARGSEYVRTVVSCYNEAIESYLNDDFTDEKIAQWDERLATVFNRGFWNGYYLGQRLGEWTHNYGSHETKSIYRQGREVFFQPRCGRISHGERFVERGRRDTRHRPDDRCAYPQGGGDTGRFETGAKDGKRRAVLDAYR